MAIPLGLSYDDVLLVPQKTDVSSRKLVDTSTYLTKDLKINIPIVSANMDTVTESDMAITMALNGGIGVIHRFLTLDEQLGEVVRVKMHDGFMIHNPRTVFPEDNLEKVHELVARFGNTGFVVVDNNNGVLGMLSKRDYVYETNLKLPVKKLMTPREKLITGRPEIDRQTARGLFARHKIEKLPVIDADNKLIGLITAKALSNEIKYPNSARDKKGMLLVGAAVGVKNEDRERAKELVKAGADVIVVDIAHGHADSVVEMTKFLKKSLDCQVVAGNVATPAGVRDLIKGGADGVKVGIGAGSVCITRIVAGAGYPQFSAVMDCAREAKKFKVPIIADQSIRAGGDVAKAVGAGAGTVMVGSLLAGTDESPGSIVIRNGRKYKITRGMASLGANLSRKIKDGAKEKVVEELKEYVAEGVEAMVPYKGKAEEVLNQLVGGFRSGMSYTGAKTVSEMQEKARFVQVTQAGIRESNHHDVELV